MQVEVKTPSTAVGAALVAAAAAAPASPVAVKTAAVAVKSAPPPKKVAAPVAKPAVVKPAVKAAEPVQAEELNPGAAIQAIVTESPVAEPVQEVVEDDGLELPSNIDLEESDNNPEGVGVVIKIFGTGCLECSCLVSDPELSAIPNNKLPSCHFSKGQDLCPARAVRIQPVGERVLFVRKWRRAQEAKDSNRVLRFTNELAGMETSLRDEIMREIGLIS